MKWGKWIGTGLGWALFGPIGAIFGFAAGAIIDADDNNNDLSTTRGDFIASLLVLIAAIMKADGTIKKVELNLVKDYLKEIIGYEESQQAVLLLRDILNEDIPLYKVCNQINIHLDYSSKLQLMYLLIEIAKVDGVTTIEEKRVIYLIASYLHIPSNTFDSLLKSPNSIEASYAILEITPEVSDEEVKKAYRRLATEHHPDKVSYLGEEIQRKAQEKFKKINEAYEIIKKHRNLK